MGLLAGTRLGPYEIVTPIGAGGMGAVYRARDSRLARDVAIKVLATEAVADAASRDRFQREARAVAALTHPHICAIHDVGCDADRDYLVLELIDGESLAARLQRGPLPLPEALARAKEIAAAVGHAHRRGIVHRDLKPGNVMLTRSGAKVLDFGLARIVRGESTAAQTTIVTTEPGLVLGTLPYMAPEQIEGRVADARADVFAFGAMFYEMVTGKRAFDAPSSGALMAAILRDQPPSLRTAAAAQPASVDRLITACLAKNPDDRIGDMHDVAIALQWIEDDGFAMGASADRSGSLTRRAVMGGAITAFAAAAGYLAATRRTRPAAPPRQFVVDIPIPPGCRNGPGIALSPNGRWLACSFNPRQALWLYDLESSEWSRPRHVVTNGLYPFWSPDGSELGYFSADVPGVQSKLWRARMPDGVPVPICDFNFAGAKAGAWLTDGSIVMAAGRTGLYRVSAAGGDVSEFLKLAQGEESLRFPTSAGDHCIFLVQRTGQPSVLRQVTVDGRTQLPIPVASVKSAFADGGNLFYSRNDVLMAQPYDVAASRFTGEPARVPHELVASAMNVGHLQATAGAGHVAVLNERRGTQRLVWKDRSGRVLREVGTAMAQVHPAISPDGLRAAIARAVPDKANLQLFLIELETGEVRRLVTSEVEDRVPVWSADGTRIAFRSMRGLVGNGNLYSVRVDGDADLKPIDEGLFSMYPGGWLGDGSFFWATDSAADTSQHGIWISKPDGTRIQILRGNGVNQLMLSPDATRIAYISSRAGPTQQVYVDTFPTFSGNPARISQLGGRHPVWRADGKELFYVDGGTLMATPIGDPLTNVGRGVPLFAVSQLPDGRSYAPSADGRRFLVLEEQTATSFSIRLTLNWRASSSTDRPRD